MRTTTKVQISSEAERLLDKIAKKGGYNSRSIGAFVQVCPLRKLMK